MPHKRNPILSERIAGLARLLRGYAQTAFENQPLWHERDISHSSAERVILPDATILLDYMLVKMTGLVEGLVVRAERMRENIERGLGLHAVSASSLALVERAGLSREDAYAIVQRAALRAADERGRCASCSPPTRRSRSELPLADARRLLRRRGVPAPRAGDHRAGSTPSRRRSDGRRRPSMLPLSAFIRSGKVRDLYAIGRRAAAARRVATGSPRSTSSCRRRSPTRAAC